MSTRPGEKRLVVSLIALVSLILLVATIVLAVAGYDAVAHRLIVFAGKARQEETFKAAFFTRRTYRVLIALVGLLAVGTGFLSLALNRYFDPWRAALVAAVAATLDPVRRAIGRFRTLAPATKASVVFLILLQGVVTATRELRIPVSYDEAWTYLNFTSRSVLTSLSYYPAPNNHILFSVITNFTRVLPFGPLLDMRVVSLLAAVATTLTVIIIGLRCYRETAVVLGASLLVFSHPASVYAVQARGYMLLVLFTAVCLASAARLVARPGDFGSLIWFTISSVLGLFTIPSFLYAFASVNAATLWQLWRRGKVAAIGPWLLANVAVVIATLILYAPVFLVSGIGSIAANPNVEPRPVGYVLEQMPSHFESTASWLTSVQAGGLVIVGGILAIGAIARRRDALDDRAILRGMSASVVLLPPVILLVHRAMPFERTWIYLLVPLVVLVTDILDRALAQGGRWVPAWAPIPVALALAAATSGRFERRYMREYVRDFEAAELFAGIPVSSLASVAYDDVYYADLLTYRLQITHRDQIVSHRITPGVPVDADALVAAKDAPQAANASDYSLWRENDRVRVLLKTPR